MNATLKYGAAILAVLVAGVIGGRIGYTLASKRAAYNEARLTIVTATSSNAQLEAKYYDRVLNNNDRSIAICFNGVRKLPQYLVDWYTAGEEPGSEKHFTQRCDAIEGAFKRLDGEIDREEIEAVVQDYRLSYVTRGPNLLQMSPEELHRFFDVLK